jgi:hypothetical protein
LDDNVLDAAVIIGHLPSVKLLVSQGLPQKPYLPGYGFSFPKRSANDHVRCLQHLLDNGCPIHPGIITSAASFGKMDAVLYLHSRGLQLWDSATEEDGNDLECNNPVSRFAGSRRQAAAISSKHDKKAVSIKRRLADLTRKQVLQGNNIIAIPKTLQDAAHMWKVLRYGWGVGAPLTPPIEEAFKAKRAATRAVLICFHIGAKLSQEEGTSLEERSPSGPMGRVPPELIEDILVHADFEIRQSLRHSLPTSL